MLKSIQQIIRERSVVVPVPDPPRTCESCGKVVQESPDAINVVISVGSPGHKDLQAFQCPEEQHWACSIECWSKVAHACLDEHILEILKIMHKQKGLT